MQVRPADAAEIDHLARLWHDSWHEAHAPLAPPELVRKVKDTMRAVQHVDHHDLAVDIEIEAQVWSTKQPFFRERLAAMQKKITSK